MPKTPNRRRPTPDPDEEEVPSNAVPKKVPAKAKKAPPKPPKAIPGAPFQPVTLMPMSETAILNNPMAREIKQPSGPLEPPSPTIGIMGVLINGFTKGADIDPIKADIQRISSNQVERAALLDALENQLNQERRVALYEMRSNAERVILQGSRRGDLTTAEALSVWKLSQDGIIDCRNRDSKTKPLDSVTVVNKVDIHQQRADVQMAERWEGTTPQGREIIRKKLHELKKRVQSVQDGQS